MTRQMIYVFFGRPRARAPAAHESPRVLTIPLLVLAVCTMAFSVVLTPAWPWLHSYLAGETPHSAPGRLVEPTLFVSLALVGIGIALGALIYRKVAVGIGAQEAGPLRFPLSEAGMPKAVGHVIDPLQRTQPALFRFLANKMWIDELYTRTIVGFSWIIARASDWMDGNVWDRCVRAIASFGQLFGTITSGVDERAINSGVDETTIGARSLGRIISRGHSGQVQAYLGIIAIAMLALLLIYAWLT